MSTKRATKRALLTSILAICLCLVMLIGSTFAWFTDTASTGVNKITSGNLHVEIQDSTNAKIENLVWVKEDGTAIANQDSILWEPGCTYLLTPFKIVNTGNLALKYKIVITGLDGDSKLLDVIKFTYKTENGDVFDMNAEGHLTAKGTDGAATEMITVSAHMDEAAGNDYQDKTLEGVQITVYATQYTEEYDSIDNKYDENAEYGYPVSNEQTSIIQKQLDAATDGTTIQLAPNTHYGTLYFRQSGKSATFSSGATGNGSVHVDAEKVTYDYHPGRTDVTYMRTLKNVTILGAEGSVVDGIEFMNGNYKYAEDTAGQVSGNTIYKDTNTETNHGADADWDNRLISCFTIENLSIKDVAFSGTKTVLALTKNVNDSGLEALDQRYTINGLSFVNCKMTASAENVQLLNVNYVSNAKNITIDGCTVSGAQYVLNASGLENLTITNNTFSNSGYADVLLNGGNMPKCTGTVTITGNTSTGAYRYFVRIGDKNGMSSLSLSGNTASSASEEFTAVKVGTEVYTQY